MRKVKTACTFLALLFVSGLGLSAQTATDSVRIKLRTSPGAEIGLDGDVSSTNILTTRTNVGKHKVTVTYGADFIRTFDIEVTREQTFEFNIEGKVTINSNPSKHKVFIGSVEQGVTPLTINVLGAHNLRIEGDGVTWFDATERINVNPFQEMELSYTLSKRPPQLYGVMMANCSSAGYGAMLGIVRRWGCYIRFAGNANVGDATSANFKNPDNTVTGVYRGDEQAHLMAATGLMLRFSKNLYAYVGGGYGGYARLLVNEYAPYNNNDSKSSGNDYGSGKKEPLYGHNGPIIDGGLILKWKALLLSAGYTRVLGSNYYTIPYHEFNVGVGFTIHRNNRR